MDKEKTEKGSVRKLRLKIRIQYKKYSGTANNSRAYIVGNRYQRKESFSPRSGRRGRRGVCDGDTSTKPAGGPETGHTEAAASTPAR